MKKDTFSIPEEQHARLLALYPNRGKNSDIGKLAVEISKLYFLSKNLDTQFFTNKNGIDLSTCINGFIENYEVKGTEDKDISWNKLKVSSKNCHDLLVNGMTLIRITDIRSISVTLYFLKHNEDFKLVPEPRWSVRKTNIKDRARAMLQPINII